MMKKKKKCPDQNDHFSNHEEQLEQRFVFK